MLGTGHCDSLILDDRRESTASAYLRPAIGRPNLSVHTYGLARRLIIQGDRCTGVEYQHDGRLTSVTSAQEVVVCAGAIGSPHLLMLSGVGPAAELTSLGVKVCVDLPGVGRDLQDHILLAGIRYHAERPLPPTADSGGSTVFAKTEDGDHGPDLLLSAMNFDYHMPWQQPAANAFTITIGHMRPRSRGSVRLVSADPSVPPAIDPAYAADPHDLDELIRGVEMVDRVVATGAFERWGGSCDTTAMLKLDRSELEAAIRDAISSYFHLSCSCRMGSDSWAVVDPQLRVHGLRGLRVADASAMPRVVSCNTNAASVMIGEKASDLIRGTDPLQAGDVDAAVPA